jgi:hypothetical protein
VYYSHARSTANSSLALAPTVRRTVQCTVPYSVPYRTVYRTKEFVPEEKKRRAEIVPKYVRKQTIILLRSQISKTVSRFRMMLFYSQPVLTVLYRYIMYMWNVEGAPCLPVGGVHRR